MANYLVSWYLGGVKVAVSSWEYEGDTYI